MNRLRPRFTYANVVATLALFLVLTGGAAYAATHLPKNSVGSKQLRKNSVTAAKIKNGTITGAKINLGTLGKVPSAASADHATTAAKANSADTAASADHATTAASANSAATAALAANATEAGNANRLGGLASSSYAQKGETLFATVAPASSAAQVLRGRGAISVEREAVGFYKVKFNRDISGCTWEATYGTPGNEAVSGAIWATVRGVGGPDEVGVVLYDTAANLADGKGFTVVVFCP
jgi:hypothetical protein